MINRITITIKNKQQKKKILKANMLNLVGMVRTTGKEIVMITIMIEEVIEAIEAVEDVEWSPQRVTRRGGSVADPRCPWQNGRTERAGGEWKKQFRLARRRDEPTTDAEFTTPGELCCSVRNRYQNRSGYTPMQRAFGVSGR